MKFSEIRDAYYLYTGLVSERFRQLALAGIAVIWLITKDPSWATLTKNSRLALVFLVLALAFDFLQYLWSAALWCKEKVNANRKIPPGEPIDKQDFEPWAGINTVSMWFFWAKCTFMVIGYGLILYGFVVLSK